VLHTKDFFIFFLLQDGANNMYYFDRGEASSSFQGPQRRLDDGKDYYETLLSHYGKIICILLVFNNMPA